jgi:hypothetical protein
MGAVLPQQRTWGSGLAYFAGDLGDENNPACQPGLPQTEPAILRLITKSPAELGSSDGKRTNQRI